MSAVIPVIAIHAGAGPASPDHHLREEAREALIAALARGRDALGRGGGALDAVQAAVAYMEDEVEFFNAGRGAVLCEDGTVELSAAIMRGVDQDAGAVALVTRSASPVAAARAVMERSPHVLLAGEAADRFAAANGIEQRAPASFVTERQRARLADRGSDFSTAGTVGAVCLDSRGALAAATSTGGRRGQMPGRIGDTPTIGAGTWADARVAVSCTGDGEAFVRAAAARTVAASVHDGEPLADAARRALQDVRRCEGTGGLIAVSADGEVALPFTSGAMNRASWRDGEDPQAWV